MGYLSEKFIEARKAKKISLEEASAATNIKIDYLRALEGGDYDKLPSGAYVRGFVKIYSGYLSLDYQVMLRLLEEEYGTPESEVELIDRSADHSVPFLPRVKLSSLLVVAAGVLVAGLIVWGVISIVGGRGSSLPKEQFRILDDPFTEETFERIQIPDRSGPPSPGELSLTAQATREVWLEVRSDGMLVFFGTLKPERSATWKAGKEYRLKAGDPSSLNLTLNGSPVTLPPDLPPDKEILITRRGIAVHD